MTFLSLSEVRRRVYDPRAAVDQRMVNLQARDILEDAVRCAVLHGVTVEQVLDVRRGRHRATTGHVRAARAQFWRLLRDERGFRVARIARLCRVDRWTVYRAIGGRPNRVVRAGVEE
jgi:hypothetical protein